MGHVKGDTRSLDYRVTWGVSNIRGTYHHGESNGKEHGE